MSRKDVTRLLKDWHQGNEAALEQLVELIYDDLKKLARTRVRGLKGGQTLQPTALVNESYLRLVDQQVVDWQNRNHFFAIAARTMRRILIDAARRRDAIKRGGEIVAVPLTRSEPVEEMESLDLVDILALHSCLEDLQELAPRQVSIVELRFFAGLTIRETAEVLGTSPATVKKDWEMARNWLCSRLRVDL